MNLVEKFTLSVVRGLLNGSINRFTPEELQQAIDEDRNLWGATSSHMRNQMQGLKNRFRNHFTKFIDQINTPLLVEWLQKDQPRLHQVIMSSTVNYNWFDRQVTEFLKMIKTM